jgi:hypothetical protein
VTNNITTQKRKSIEKRRGGKTKNTIRKYRKTHTWKNK